MVDAELIEVRQWLLKARRDLESAWVLLDRELNDTGVYHCQQVVEKSLKVYLAWHNVPLMKVHDLTVLVKECSILDVSFEVLLDMVEILTPYATAFRYPGDFFEPDQLDAEEALQLSAKVFEFVQDKLPEQLMESTSS